MRVALKFILISHFFILGIFAVPQYYCTAANWPYFHRLMNLIGSIQKYNYDELVEIAVYDLGLHQEQIDLLQKIQKVKVYKIQDQNPNLLTTFYPPGARPILGWYAWKPVVIKESLERFPYVLWLDAGTTVRKPIRELFQHIIKEGYFICTIGDSYWNGAIDPLHPVGWGTPAFVREQFHLTDSANEWVLRKETIMGGIVGSTRAGGHCLIRDWCTLTNDIRYFADDGTAPEGFGTARHDQTVLSILAYLRGLNVHQQDWAQLTPMMLSTDEGEMPFYITWHRQSVKDWTNIYSSRDDLSYHEEYMSHIQYKQP